MKQFIPLAFFILLVGCSERTSKESASDLTKEDTTLMDLSDELVEESDMIEDLMTVVVNTDAIESKISELGEKLTQQNEELYTVEYSSNGYEYLESATWYVDQSFALRYYKTDWSMEGNDGESEFHFNNDKIVCATEIESGGGYTTTTYACDGIGGLLVSSNDEAQDEQSQALPADYMKTKMDELKARYRSLVDLVRKNEAIQNGDDYTITIEKTESYGEEDVTETTSVVISDKLYQHLVRAN